MLGPATLNHAPFCVVTIETVEGMNHVEAIAATPGIDCLMLGGKDLAVDMGLPLTDIYSGKTPPPVMDEMDKLIEACRRHGKIASCGMPTDEEAEDLLACGARLVPVGAAHLFLMANAKRQAGAAERWCR